MRVVVIVGMVVAATAGGYAVGRFSAPEKIKIETRTDETKETDTKRREEKTIVEIVKPDGTKETVTTVVTDTDRKTASDKTTAAKREETKSPAVNVSALLGVSVSGFTPTYGASISRQILGPVSIGAFGLTSGQFGLSVGLSF